MSKNRFTKDREKAIDDAMVLLSAPSTIGSNGANGRASRRKPDVSASALPPSPNGSNGAHTNGRQANGKFAPGNAGGPGNPFARQVAKLRQLMFDTVTPEDMQEITKTLVLHAKAGNVAAAKLLLQYMVGKPAPEPRPDLLDEDEADRFDAHGPMFGRMSKRMVQPGPDLSLGLVRDAKPIVTRERAVQFGTVMSLPDKQREPLLDRMKSMTDGEAAQELRKLAKEMGIGQPPSANGANGAKPAGQAHGCR